MKHILFVIFFFTLSCTNAGDDSAEAWFSDDQKMTRDYSVPLKTRTWNYVFFDADTIEIDGDILRGRQNRTMIFNSTRFDIEFSEGSLSFYNEKNEGCWMTYEITSVDYGSEVKVDLLDDKVSIVAGGEGKVEVLLHGRHRTSTNCETPNPENVEYTLELNVVIPDSAPFIVAGDCGSTPRASENAIIRLYSKPVKNGEVLKNLVNWHGYPNFSVTQDAPFLENDFNADRFDLEDEYVVSGIALRNLKRGNLRFETEFGDVVDILVTPVSDLRDFELIPYLTHRTDYPFVGDQIHGGSLPFAISKPTFANQHCNDAAAPILTSLTPEVCEIKTNDPFFVTLFPSSRDPVLRLASIPAYIDFETGQTGECQVTARSGERIIQTFSFENLEK